MNPRPVFALASLILLLSVHETVAQHLTVQYREISVDEQGIEAVVGDALFEDEPSEIAGRLFAMDASGFSGEGVESSVNTVYFRDGMMRMESTHGIILMDFEARVVRSLDSAAKTYFEWPLDDPSSDEYDEYDEYEDDYGDEYDDEGPSEAVGSGVAATINGWETTSEEVSTWERFEVAWCAAEDSPIVEAMRRVTERMAFLDDGDDDEGGDALCNESIPVREQSFDLMGYRFSVSEMLSVSEEPVAADLFQIPSGYSKVAPPY